MLSHKMDGPPSNDERGRKLRNQLLLANIAAWIAIIIAVRYFFF